MRDGATGAEEPSNGMEPSRRHFLHVFSSFAVGGPEVRLSAIMNHFGRKYRHTISAMDGRYSCRSRLTGELDVRFLELPGKRPGLLGSVARSRAILRDVRPDLLLTYNWGAIEWALTQRVFGRGRHIHFESGFGPEEAERQLPRRVLFRRIALARAWRIVVPSRTLEDLALRVWKLRPETVLYIPNGIDCGRFAGPPAPRNLPGFSKAPRELVVGTVAPLRAVKNVPRLIEAFARLAARFEIRLLLVGDGPERAALEALAARAGVADKVFFAGHVEDPEAVLGWLDVFAITSHTEQMPNSLLQAMAAGRPVVGMDVGDVKQMVSPENRRYIAPRGDDTRFESMLAQLIEDPAARRDIGRANERHVRENFGQERMFRAYEALFDH